MRLATSLVLLWLPYGAVLAGGDLEICKLEDLQQFDRDGTEVGLAVSTTAWNPGTQPLDWHASPDSRHPFIAQSLYRWSDGRLTQIGIAGVKHGYYVAASPGCGGQQCTNPTADVLHQNCSDTYGSSLNANQRRMGPRYEINPWTGAWSYPGSHLTQAHNHAVLDHLLRVQDADLKVTSGSDVRYFVEVFYVHYQNEDPSTAAAWSHVNVLTAAPNWSFDHDTGVGAAGKGFTLNPTVWPGLKVTEIAQAVPIVRGQSPDGRARLGSSVKALGNGRWRYDYALLNVDMDRQIGEFTVPIPPQATITDIRFFAPHQPNETRNGVPGIATDDSVWSQVSMPATLTWKTSKNPLRWGVMYNFSFVADAAPTEGNVSVGLFKAGTPSSINGLAQVPGALDPVVPVSPIAVHQPFVGKQVSARVVSGPRNTVRRNAIAAVRFDAGDGPTSPPVEMNINAHGDECLAAIGPIPSFNCLDGKIIPITVDGSEPPSYSTNMDCDRPVQLGLANDGQCVPYARLGKLPSVNAAGQPDPDVQWTFICRRYSVQANPDYPKFEDVAIIGHRASTGATCFFQMLDPQGKLGTRVPSPSERAASTPPGQLSAEQFWLHPQQTASINCYRCHDSDPWIHTPYVDQVREAGDPNKPLVPTAPRVEDPLHYTFVGSRYFDQWPAPEQFLPRNNECVACHRIGIRFTSQQFVEYASGLRMSNQTAWSKVYPRSHWMPPESQAGAATLAQWNALYKDSVDQIRSCGLQPDQPACKRQPINSP